MLCVSSVALICGILPAPRADADELSERRARLDGMSAEEKKELLRKKQRFDRLSPDEQARMRSLHVAISQHENADRLRSVLERYNQWLKTLPESERAKLLGMPADQRIMHIKRLRQQQERKTFGLLGDRLAGPPGDVEKLFRWASEFVEHHESELLLGLPPAYRQQVLRADARRRHRMLMFSMIGLLGRRRSGQPLPQPDAGEIRKLSEALSPRAKQFLLNETDSARRTAIVYRWLQAAVVAKLLPPIQKDELRRFYEKELKDYEKAKLDEMPADEAQRQLRRLYYQRYYKRGFQVVPRRLPNRRDTLPGRD